MKQKFNDKMINPASVLIEQTAADLCAEYYEIGRSQGLHSKHKTHKAFVHAHIEQFIPIAVDLLTSMLGMPHASDDQKVLIHEALIERANDPDLSFMDEKIPDFKEPEKQPIILNSESISSRFTRK